ncbi:hypothetical protein VTN77DRAFT_4833 [Rasamsonia byssochlamydoides]|uniref:uncharacterized protein n=1 Tax=Rasamsonia byssochlamydoides TaxID=89139 RepID=UPI003743573D
MLLGDLCTVRRYGCKADHWLGPRSDRVLASTNSYTFANPLCSTTNISPQYSSRPGYYLLSPFASFGSKHWGPQAWMPEGYLSGIDMMLLKF